jgi:diacylglycerol O-acyltransferase
MSPIDSSFLHIENGTTPMHIGGVSIFEGPPPPFEQLHAMVVGKLGLVPRYRAQAHGGRQRVGSATVRPLTSTLKAPLLAR